MNVILKDLEKSQVELIVELSTEEFAPYIERGAQVVSEKINIEGFRPGKAPLEIIKQKIGEMTILEEAAHIAISKTIDKVIEENLKERHPIGQPKVEVTKLAPENPFEFKVILALLPQIELSEYKNFGLKEEEAKVDEKEVRKAISELAESRAKESVSEGPIKTGDKVIMSIDMFLDKVPAEDGQIKDLTAIIGKDYLVPGFDKQLLDHKKGEDLEFSLPYPDDHHMKHLAGKMVDFKVKISDVFTREIPAVDDELAKTFGLKKAEDIEKFFNDNFMHRAKQQAAQKAEIQVLDKILEKTKFSDLPEILIENETEVMLGELEHEIAHYGGNFTDYLKNIKKTRNELILDLLPNAVRRVKSSLLIREIAKKEDVKVSSEELDKKIEEIKEQYKTNEQVQQTIKEPGYRGYLESILTNQKVIAKLREWNIN